ncbi:MAG: SMI1/KNR4 family protein [Bacillota bacterium]
MGIFDKLKKDNEPSPKSFDDIAGELDSTQNLIREEDLAEVEEAVGAAFGPELRRYILEYGYLGYEFWEMYGVNSIQGPDSDMVKQTAYLHEFFPATAGYVAIEGDGDMGYRLVDSEDMVFEFDPGSQEVKPTGKKLFDYIAGRYEYVKSLM